MDVQKVKIINRWALDDSSKDESIEALISHYAEIAGDYCNKTFETPYPARVQEFIAKSIDYHNPGLSSRSMGSVSYSFDEDYQSKLNNLLAPYRQLNWGGSSCISMNTLTN